MKTTASALLALLLVAHVFAAVDQVVPVTLYLSSAREDPSSTDPAWSLGPEGSVIQALASSGDDLSATCDYDSGWCKALQIEYTPPASIFGSSGFEVEEMDVVAVGAMSGDGVEFVVTVNVTEGIINGPTTTAGINFGGPTVLFNSNSNWTLVGGVPFSVEVALNTIGGTQDQVVFGAVWVELSVVVSRTLETVVGLPGGRDEVDLDEAEFVRMSGPGLGVGVGDSVEGEYELTDLRLYCGFSTDGEDPSSILWSEAKGTDSTSAVECPLPDDLLCPSSGPLVVMLGYAEGTDDPQQLGSEQQTVLCVGEGGNRSLPWPALLVAGGALVAGVVWAARWYREDSAAEAGNSGADSDMMTSGTAATRASRMSGTTAVSSASSVMTRQPMRA